MKDDNWEQNWSFIEFALQFFTQGVEKRNFPQNNFKKLKAPLIALRGNFFERCNSISVTNLV